MPRFPLERHSRSEFVDSEVLERSLKTCGLARMSLRRRRCLDALSYLARPSSQLGTSHQPPQLKLWVQLNELERLLSLATRHLLQPLFTCLRGLSGS